MITIIFPSGNVSHMFQFDTSRISSNTAVVSLLPLWANRYPAFPSWRLLLTHPSLPWQSLFCPSPRQCWWFTSIFSIYLHKYLPESWKKLKAVRKKRNQGKTFNSVQNEYLTPKQVVWWWYGLLKQFSAINQWISCLEQSRMWYSDWLVSV